MKLVNSAGQTKVTTTSTEGLVQLSGTFAGADSGSYVVSVTTAAGLTDVSDTFDIHVYGTSFN